MELSMVGGGKNKKKLADAIWFCLVDVYHDEIEHNHFRSHVSYYVLSLIEWRFFKARNNSDSSHYLCISLSIIKLKLSIAHTFHYIKRPYYHSLYNCNPYVPKRSNLNQNR